MAGSTTHYNLIKPAATDTSEIITDLNSNYDDIDSILYDKADKDADAVSGNIAKFDANGNPVDSGIASSGWEAAKNAVDNATNLATANTLVKRDANGRAQVEIPSSADDIANKGYVDTILQGHEGSIDPHLGFAYYQDLIYTDGVLTQIDEKINDVLRKRTTLTYEDGVLTSVNVKDYASDGQTKVNEYTDTLSYSNGVLEYVERSLS